MTATQSRDLIRVGNCSGFYGDRISAMREMLEGGQLDYLTGDYLAELTMLILGRDRTKDPGTGYAKTFLLQLKDCLSLALDRGVRIVANAGGVNTPSLVTAIRELAAEEGLHPRIAHVTGDDLTTRAAGLGLGHPLGAHAYLGGFGIARALDAGADIVVTGRVTDASVVVAPAISEFAWKRDDYDALAGATAAAHVIECGTQATGGNFSFFSEIDQLIRPGFPLAELHRDGSSTITKHEGTGGAVNIETVASQLLYEVTDGRYAGPDVTTRLDTLHLEQAGPDRVRISGTRGEAPPPELKVSLTSVGGYRNELTMVLTGLDIEAKADLARRQFTDALKSKPAEIDWNLARVDAPDAPTQQQASALLTVTARDPHEQAVGRVFSSAAIEIALGSYPGFHLLAPPGRAAQYGVFTPGYVPQDAVVHEVVLPDGTAVAVGHPESTKALEPLPGSPFDAPATSGPTRDTPLGRLAGARSGDKGGNANIGVWARNPGAYPWLSRFLTAERVRELIPEAHGLDIRVAQLPNLSAVNIVIEGLLGEGVAYNNRFDPQAKGLAEWLRSRVVPAPIAFLEEQS